MAQIIIDSSNNLIQGDFDNATVNNRTKFKTTTLNGTTNVYAVPNGSSTSAGYSVSNNADPTNASKITIATNGATDTQIISGINGTGSYLPLNFYTNNALSMTIDTANNVGIGTASPVGDVTRYLNIVGAGGAGIFLHDSNQGSTAADGTTLQASGTNTYLYNREAGFMAFGTSDSERMRINSSGQVLIGTTSVIASANGPYLSVVNGNATNYGIAIGNSTGSSTSGAIIFVNSNGSVGGITTSGSATTYSTSSDYRLKENIVPMVSALDTVALLKPVTYKWKVDGSTGQGFIAHELQAVIPDCVTGEKDAVETYTDEEGNEQTRIKPQGVDTSFLVATLTAAIQEQQTIINELKTRIEALESK